MILDDRNLTFNIDVIWPSIKIYFEIRHGSKRRFSLGLFLRFCFSAPWNVTSEQCRQSQEAFLGSLLDIRDVTNRTLWNNTHKNLTSYTRQEIMVSAATAGGEPSALLSTRTGMKPSRLPWVSVIFTSASKSKLSTWGCLGRCWKTPTTKSSTTPNFRPLLSPLSSSWILVSCILCCSFEWEPCVFI